VSRRVYSLQPQRLQPGEGYIACEPHRACRVVIIETTFVPPKRGRRAYHIKRKVATFSGSGAMLRAQLELDSLIGRSKPSTDRRRGVWGRSMTRLEYDNWLREKEARS